MTPIIISSLAFLFAASALAISWRNNMALSDQPAKIDSILTALTAVSTKIDALKASQVDPVVAQAISDGLDKVVTAVNALAS